MIVVAVVLGAVGLLLSAFFSGSEIGFYRVPRIRLVLDALRGDWIARILLWLANRPSLFIATTLVGNNLANYAVSFAIVMAAQAIFRLEGHAVEIIAPLMFTPVVFVYGELLPKNLFLHAPNRMLRKGGPWFVLCVVLFFPVAAALWALDRLLAALVAEKAAETVRLTIARRELRILLEEGHQVGILRPSQRELARGIFAVAKDPVSRYAASLSEVPCVSSQATKQMAQQAARQRQSPVVLIEDSQAPGRLAGYTRVVDLDLAPSDQLVPVRPLLKVRPEDRHLDVLMRLRSHGEELAELVDSDGHTLGVVLAEALFRPLVQSSQAPLSGAEAGAVRGQNPA